MTKSEYQNKRKIYIVIEKFTEDCEREENVFDKWVHSAHTTKEGAINAVKSRHDEIIEEIIDGDENELSRISFDHICDDDWGNGVCATIENDTCSKWELSINELPLYN